MGNQKSQEVSQEKLKKFEEAFQFHSKVRDPRSDTLEIYSSKFSNEFISKYIKIFADENKYDEIVSNLHARMTLNHKNLLKFHGFRQQQKNNFCGNTSSCTIFEEFYFNNLNEEINKRTLNKVKILTQNPFEEGFLLKLGKTLLDVLVYMEDHSIFHSNIHPSAIYFDEGNEPRLSVTNALLVDEFGNKISSQNNLFYPNSEINQIKLSQKNPHKIDLFAFGLSLLHAASLENPCKLFDAFGVKVQEDKLNNELSSLEQFGYKQLPAFLKEVLIPEISKRPTPKEFKFKIEKLSQTNSPIKILNENIQDTLGNIKLPNENIKNSPQNFISPKKHKPNRNPTKTYDYYMQDNHQIKYLEPDNQGMTVNFVTNNFKPKNKVINIGEQQPYSFVSPQIPVPRQYFSTQALKSTGIQNVQLQEIETTPFGSPSFIIPHVSQPKNEIRKSLERISTPKLYSYPVKLNAAPSSHNLQTQKVDSFSFSGSSQGKIDQILEKRFQDAMKDTRSILFNIENDGKAHKF